MHFLRWEIDIEVIFIELENRYIKLFSNEENKEVKVQDFVCLKSPKI